MDMKLIILASISFSIALAGPLAAADQQLLNLVMPDVKVISDVNVAQAKATPFGQYVLNELTNAGVEQLTALTGFDPSKDLNELVCASNGTAGATLAVATGIFDPIKIANFAAQNGTVTETYQNVTILEDSKKINGVAFLHAGLMAAGDIADVKAAIGRQTAPSNLPTSLTMQIAALSNTEDAWVISTVPPASLAQTAAPKNPGVVGGIAIPVNTLQQVQSGWAGVKFGSNITVTAQAQTADAQSATNLAGMMQLLQNIALMQASQNAALGAFAQSIEVTAQGASVNFSASLPEDQFQKLVQSGKPHTARKK